MAGTVKDMLEQILGQMNEGVDRVGRLEEIIVSEDNPTKGLLWRMAMVEKWIADNGATVSQQRSAKWAFWGSVILFAANIVDRLWRRY